MECRKLKMPSVGVKLEAGVSVGTGGKAELVGNTMLLGDVFVEAVTKLEPAVPL